MAISVSNLRMSYDDVVALRGVSFEVPFGEVFALLGPNGAGKTTAVEILEGYRRRDGGSVSVLGFDPDSGGAEFRDRIGIVLQESGVEPTLTVREVFELYRHYYSTPAELENLIEVSGLDEKVDMRVATLSGGQRRRLDLGLALAGNPDVIFLDEPTTGFDPAARRKAWELVRGLTGSGKTVLLTTHYLDEAQFLADRIAVIVGGEIVAIGTPQELSTGGHTSRISFEYAGPAETLPGLSAPPDIAGNRVVIQSSRPTSDLHTLTGWAVRNGVELSHLAVQGATLEDVYLSIVDDAGETE